MLMLLQLRFIFLQMTTLYALLWGKFAMSQVLYEQRTAT